MWTGRGRVTRALSSSVVRLLDGEPEPAPPPRPPERVVVPPHLLGAATAKQLARVRGLKTTAQGDRRRR